MANVDTPGYQARDLDFRAALDGAQQQNLSVSRTRSNHIQPDGGAAALEAQLKYRVPNQPSLDGNTVELHIEQAQFADNAVRYQATLTFLGSKFNGLKDAITGGR